MRRQDLTNTNLIQYSTPRRFWGWFYFLGGEDIRTDAED